MTHNNEDSTEPTHSVPRNAHLPNTTNKGIREYEKRESGEQAVPGVPAEHTGDSTPDPDDVQRQEQEHEQQHLSDEHIGKKIGKINRNT